MDFVFQPLYCRDKCITKTFVFSSFKEYESSRVRNLHDFGMNTQRTYKLREYPDSENVALEIKSGFAQKSLHSGMRTRTTEVNSKDMANVKVIKEHSRNECREIEKLDLDRQRIHKRAPEMGYDRASILALEEERQLKMSLEEEIVKQVKSSNGLMALNEDLRHSNKESRRPCPSIEILSPLYGSLHWKEGIVTAIIFGASFAFMKLIVSRKKPQVYSIRGRILKSQWYGNPQSRPWEQNCFEQPSVKLNYKDTPLFSSPNRSLRSTSRNETNCASICNELKPARPPHYPIRQPLYERNGFDERTMKQKNYKGLESSINKKNLHDPVANGSHKKYAYSGSRNSGPRMENINNALGAGNDSTNFALQKGIGVYGKQSLNVGRALTDVNKKANQQMWIEKDKFDLESCISELFQTVQAVEHHRRTVMIALNEERQRSIVLEGEILKQKQAAAALSKEIQNLKDSHNALLTSLRKKYSSAIAVRAAADLIYQNFEVKASAE